MFAFSPLRSLIPLLAAACLVQAAPVTRRNLEILNATGGPLHFELPFPRDEWPSGIVWRDAAAPIANISIPEGYDGARVWFFLSDADPIDLPVGEVEFGWGQSLRFGKNPEYMVTMTFDDSKISYRFARAQSYLAKPKEDGRAAAGAGQQSSMPLAAAAGQAGDDEWAVFTVDPGRFLDDPWKITKVLEEAYIADLGYPGPEEVLKLTSFDARILMGHVYENHIPIFYRTGEGSMINDPELPRRAGYPQPPRALLDLGGRWIALRSVDAQRGEQPDFQVPNRGWGYKGMEVVNDGNNLLHALDLAQRPDAREGERPHAAPKERVEELRTYLMRNAIDHGFGNHWEEVHRTIRNLYRVVLNGGTTGVGPNLRRSLERCVKEARIAAAEALRAKEFQAGAAQQAAAAAPRREADAGGSPAAAPSRRDLIETLRRQADLLIPSQSQLLLALGVTDSGMMVEELPAKTEEFHPGDGWRPVPPQWVERPVAALSDLQLEHFASVLDLAAAKRLAEDKARLLMEDPAWPWLSARGATSALAGQTGPKFIVTAYRATRDRMEELINEMFRWTERNPPKLRKWGDLGEIRTAVGAWALAVEEVERQKGTTSASTQTVFDRGSLDRVLRGPCLAAYDRWRAGMLSANAAAEQVRPHAGTLHGWPVKHSGPSESPVAKPGAAAVVSTKSLKRKEISVTTLVERWQTLAAKGQGPLLAALGLAAGSDHPGSAQQEAGAGSDGDTVMTAAAAAAEGDTPMTPAAAAAADDTPMTPSGPLQSAGPRAMVLPDAEREYWDQCLESVESLVHNRELQTKYEGQGRRNLMDAVGAKARVEYMVSEALRIAGGHDPEHARRLRHEISTWTAALARASSGPR